ncbi:MAG: MFS transporter [Burkholderiaceae bacterium]|jgi:MFS family permease|nr:MFS transporter [Burkholderiales bacterium]MCZ8340014.1 MFS transporter [Burkholderiaceae bacterium]
MGTAHAALDDPAHGRRALAAIVAATVPTLPYGTIYAYSVFLAPMERMLGIGRADMAFVFSLAAITLTIGMVGAPRLYRRFPPATLLLGCGALSACGLAVAATADGLGQLALGYGVLFGLGGGVVFTTLQQGMNQTISTRTGLVNGYYVSLYPAGAMIGTPLLGWAIAAHGLRATLGALAVVILAGTAIAALLYRTAGLRMRDASATPADDDARRWDVFARLFGVFFLAAAAGLTVMSQSAGILGAYGAGAGLALGATSFVTGAIAAARLGGGWLVDRFAAPRVGAGAHLLALAGSLLLLAWPSPATAVAGLTMIGCGYGLVSGMTAGAIAHYWHRNAFGRVAGQIYVAWCLAAITLPMVAGWLFDRTRGYDGAMMLAAAVNLAGAALSATLPRRGASPSEDATR